MKAEKFLSLFENIVEHTPKVAEELLKLRPFQTIEIFLSSLDSVVDNLNSDEKVLIVCKLWIIDWSSSIQLVSKKMLVFFR